MDKVSEWEARPTFPRLDLIFREGPILEAYPVLYPSGACCHVRLGEKSLTLLRSEAVAVARWILATFTDEPR